MKFCPQCASQLATKVIDDSTRFICKSPGCGFIAWNNPVPVVAALVKCDEKYVIAHHKAWPSNIYSLITGYLEANESVEAAVLREVREELGLEGKIVSFLGHFTFKKKNQLIIAYEIEASGTIVLNDELDDIKTLSVNELCDYNFAPLHITEQIISRWKSLTA